MSDLSIYHDIIERKRVAFQGIGSEGYTALKCGRRFVGAELKAAYYRQALRNLQRKEAETFSGSDLLASLDA